MKKTFLTPVTLHDLWSRQGHMTNAGWVIDHCDQVSLKSIKAARRNIRLYAWLTEERTRHSCRHRRRTLPAGRQRPPWPQVDPLSCKCDRGSEVNLCIMSYMNTLCNKEEIKHFMWKSRFDPKWPRLTFDPINGIEILKLMHMYLFHEYAM